VNRFTVRAVVVLLLLGALAAVPPLYRNLERRAQLAPFQGEWLIAAGQRVTVTGSAVVYHPSPPYLDGGTSRIGAVDLSRSRVELMHPGGTMECNFHNAGDRITFSYNVTYPDAVTGPSPSFVWQRP
jgi:hypothetical protein